MNSKKHSSFLHGFGSILTLFPSQPTRSFKFVYQGKDIRFITTEQTLLESWESVGDALTSAMGVLPADGSTCDERKQLTR